MLAGNETVIFQSVTIGSMSLEATAEVSGAGIWWLFRPDGEKEPFVDLVPSGEKTVRNAFGELWEGDRGVPMMRHKKIAIRRYD